MELQLTYPRASALDIEARRLVLETATPSARVARPDDPVRTRFFDGFLTRPATTAAALRQVAQVAAADYRGWNEPGRSAGGADPLVTSDGNRLRFEAFSLCGGALGRLDVLPAGLDGSFLERGTTNVDVNEPLRRLLTRVTSNDFLHLDVGSDGLSATAPGERAVERKVALSDRWLRGLAEAQASGAGYDLRMELTGSVALRLLQAQPRHAQGWLLPSGASWRLSSRAAPGAVRLSRAGRLETLLPLLAGARSVRVFGPAVSAGDEAAPSMWQVDLPDARYVLHLSAAAERGFSGEGGVLNSLLDPLLDPELDRAKEARQDAEQVAALLDHQPVLDPVNLADRLGLTVPRVRSAMTELAMAGRVGYDVGDAAWFHRDLPYDAAAIARLNPRLRGAEALVASGGVALVSDDRADVRGTSTTHRVRVSNDGTESCTCTWWTRHRGSRGPCQHVLAARLARGGSA